jgi:hypothetical protein
LRAGLAIHGAGPRVRVLSAFLLATALASCAAPVLAEMSADEYQSGARRLTAAERAQEAARARAETERARSAERAQRAAEEEARLDEERRLAARPLGVRLVERRCTACHAPDTLARSRHGWLGWWNVLLRMEWLNGATVGPGERSIIVAHLADVQRASAARVALEWVAAITAIAVPLALVARFGRRRGTSDPSRGNRP